MANLSIVRGATGTITTTVSPAALVADSDIFFMAKRNYGDSDLSAVISKTLADGITVTDADAGEITIVIDPADTRALENRQSALIYEVEIEKSGVVYDVDSGVLRVRPELITRELA